MSDVSDILNKVEASGIADINSILNVSTERFSKGEMKLEEYKEILINISGRANKLANDVYKKNNNDPNTRLVDLEEYRTLQDISRECRDALRQLTPANNIKADETANKNTKPSTPKKDWRTKNNY